MSDLFDFSPRPRHFAVMGNPISHSKSPQIHQQFARQFDIDIIYERMQVDVGGFEQAVSHFGAHGGAGLNITVPFKVEAWRLCSKGANRLSERAKMAESVNTLRFEPDGSIHGDNTDGIGIVRDIENNIGLSLHDKDILIIGAGGAVRGVLGPAIAARPRSITIANRTPEKAASLAMHFADLGVHISGTGLDRAPDQPYDLIINGSASSLGNEVPAISDNCIGQHTVVYDMMYSIEPTIFMKWALSLGANDAHDGLGMLIEQAAEAFSLWLDKVPNTQPVISAMRKS